MSFAGLEDLKPMAGHGGGRPMGGLVYNPRPPGLKPDVRPVPTAYLHRPAGKVFELKFEYKPEMRYVGTFDSKHKWAGHYVVISAYDTPSARIMMQEKFGTEWAAVYPSTTNQSAEETAGVAKCNYKLLTNEMIREAAQEAARPFNVIEGVL